MLFASCLLMYIRPYAMPSVFDVLSSYSFLRVR
nr:MAG TPA: hypothetical protein [Caudoviricetes sp.]